MEMHIFGHPLTFPMRCMLCYAIQISFETNVFASHIGVFLWTSCIALIHLIPAWSQNVILWIINKYLQNQWYFYKNMLQVLYAYYKTLACQ